MSKAIDLWQSLPPEKMVTMLEHLGVVFELDERGLLHYTLPEGVGDNLNQLIENQREAIHSALWCRSINMHCGTGTRYTVPVTGKGCIGKQSGLDIRRFWNG